MYRDMPCNERWLRLPQRPHNKDTLSVNLLLRPCNKWAIALDAAAQRKPQTRATGPRVLDATHFGQRIAQQDDPTVSIVGKIGCTNPSQFFQKRIEKMLGGLAMRRTRRSNRP